MAAVVILLALVFGVIAYFVITFLVFIGMDSPYRFFEILAVLRWPVILVGIAFGAWLGSHLMS